MVRAGGVKCSNCNCSPGLLSRSNRRSVLLNKQINIKRSHSGNLLPSRKGSCWLIDPLTLCQLDAKEINTSARLLALRKEMAKHDLAVYIIPSEDQHQLEYTAPVDKKRSFISGFSGLAGVAIITRDIASLNDEPDGAAALLTDGRYFNQALNELDFNWRLLKQGAKGEPTWQEWAIEQAADMARDLGKEALIGIDPRLISYTQYEKLEADAQKKQDNIENSTIKVVPVLPNLVDEIWAQFEALPAKLTDEIKLLDVKYAGESVAVKLKLVALKTFKNKVAALAVSGLDEIAWLLNLRGLDIEFNPVFFSFMVLTPNENILYVDDVRLTADAKALLKENNITVKPYHEFYNLVGAISEGLAIDKREFAVPTTASWELIRAIQCPHTQVASPLTALKAVKNPVEIVGAKEAHIKDGRAIVKLLSWLEDQVVNKQEMIDEVAADEKLTEFRQQESNFVGLSFDTISATGANAAVIHYKPTKGACTTVNPTKVYLLDTGSQFLEGTTDITRTVHFSEPSAEEVRNYTLVLKGMINLATTRFPEGVTGPQIDALARQALWKHGLDYGHGTGHGIGAFLNVHEGPMGISAKIPPTTPVALAPGNYLSNEPGFYKDGDYGIRIENDMFVVDTNMTYNGKSFYEFETVSLVPYCKKLTDVKLLLPEEIEWINNYHKECWNKLSGSLDEDALKWLKRETAPIKN